MQKLFGLSFQQKTTSGARKSEEHSRTDCSELLGLDKGESPSVRRRGSQA